MKDNGAMSYTESAEVPKEGSEPIKLTEKTAEDYWFEYSHESIVEGLMAITEANFKQAIRACQSDCIESLMNQIEYQNKEANESHDKIMELEFQLKEERNKAIDECRHEIALWLTEPEKLGSELMERITALKSDSK